MTLRPTQPPATAVSDPRWATAIRAARAELAKQPKLSGDDLEKTLVEQSVPSEEAHDIARELELQRLIERYGADCERLFAFPMDRDALLELGRHTSPFKHTGQLLHPDATPTERLEFVTMHSILVQQLRSDLAMLDGRSALVSGSAAHRHRMESQLNAASARIEAIATLLNIEPAELEESIRSTTITPARADALIHQVYGSLFPPGTEFDLAQKSVRVVPPEEFARLYQDQEPRKAGFLGRMMRQLRHTHQDVPYIIPMLDRGQEVVIPLDKDRFGNGAVGLAAIAGYGHDRLQKTFAEAEYGPEATAGLTRALMALLAARLNERFDTQPDAVQIPAHLRRDVAISTPWDSAMWIEIAERVGFEKLAEGFFKDPESLRAELERRFGAPTIKKLGELTWQMFEAPLKHLSRDQVRSLLDEAESWKRAQREIEAGLNP